MRRRLVLVSLMPLFILATTCQSTNRSAGISSVSPSAGTTLGLNEATISGSNFPSTPTVTFGANAATVISSTASSIVVTVPAPTSGATGAVSVTVSSATDSITKNNAYTYRSMLVSANHGSNDVASFSVDNTVPSFALFSATNASSGGAFPSSVAVDRESQLAFVANTTTIGVFDYSFEDGVLTQIGSAVDISGSGVMAIAVDETHNVAFTANSASETVSSFIYDPDTGAMTYVESEGVGTGGRGPWDVAVDEANRLLFVVNKTTSGLFAFKYTATGDMTAVSATPTSLSGTLPTGVAVDSSVKLVFVALSGSAKVESFAYTTEGVLTAKSTANAELTPYDLAVDSTNALLFVINQGAATLKGYTFASDGTMAAASGTAIGVGGTAPFAVALDTAGQLIFVAIEGSNTIGFFSYLTDATITAEGNPVGANGTNPYGLVFIP